MRTIAIILLFVMFFVGCGKDGSDGKAYVSYTWDWYVDWYEDNNPGKPSNFYSYTDYQTSPGSYSYEYGCSDGVGNYWGYYGTYTITINSGEDGGLFSDGASGKDNHFRMSLSGGGTNFYLQKEAVKELKKELSGNPNPTLNKIDVGSPETIILYGVSGTMTITRQKYIVQ